MEVIILGRKAMSPISLHSGYVNTVMSPLSRMRIHVFQNTEDVPHPSAIMPLQTQLESQLVADPKVRPAGLSIG